MKKLFLTTFSFMFFFVLSTAQQPVSQMVNQAKADGLRFVETTLFAPVGTPLSDQDDLSVSLNQGTLLQWDAAAVARFRGLSDQPVTLRIPTSGGQLILEMVPARNFSAGFQVQTAAATGRTEQYDIGTHYWGIVKGETGSIACISVFDHEIIGLIQTGETTYNLGIIPGDNSRQHVLYQERHLKANNPFQCETDEALHQIGKGTPNDYRTGASNCVRMFIECDYTLFQNKGSVENVVSYMTGVMSQVSALYTNETINLVLHELYVWNVADPYTGPSASNYLSQFRTAKNGVFNGDLAHLVGINGLGGVAYLDVLCYPSYGVGYSSINATYNNVPTYSWTIEVLTHEIGHNLGSPHTHACAWNGNNTALDGCGPNAGYSEGCTAALPTSGTIMSYCHLVSGVGINFNNGFGTQPGDLIRDYVYNAPCLTSCDTTGGGGGDPDTCSYVSVNSQNFESDLGLWKDGGADCNRINNATFANSPTYSIQLRDNTNSSVMTTTNQNWTSYEEITVSFSYITTSFENGEDFWLQLSTNGGSSFTTLGDYNAGTEFTNGVRNNVSVVLPGPFTANTKLRFRADASADDDQVYIDDVVITGCQMPSFDGGNSPYDRNAADEFTTAEQPLSNMKLAPNPAAGECYVSYAAADIVDAELIVTDLTGRLVLIQSMTSQRGENIITLPVNDFSEGIYIVQIVSNGERLVQKMVVAR